MKSISLDHAPCITKAASQQTYYTIRFLVDRGLVADAYRAYAYFRWVDDVLDAETGLGPDRSEFLERQKSILKKCYQREIPPDADIHEKMLIDLIQNDAEQNSGLQYYLRNMMAVMTFDAERRGRLISQAELNEYTRHLAGAVTEAMHHFIGHGCYSPRDEARYLAVTAAHITHMLRDTFDDVEAGYFNIPREVLEANHIAPGDIKSEAYRNWVHSRVLLARRYFDIGRKYLSRVENPRCRFAGFAYTARFEWLLDVIEREDFYLRPQYDERKSFRTGLHMCLDVLSSIMRSHRNSTSPQAVTMQKRTLRES